MSVVLHQLAHLAGYGTLDIVLTLAVAFGIDLADARKRTPNWKLTFERPAPKAKGAVLLLQGLADSPYSMRALAVWPGRIARRTGWL